MHNNAWEVITQNLLDLKSKFIQAYVYKYVTIYFIGQHFVIWVFKCKAIPKILFQTNSFVSTYFHKIDNYLFILWS